MHKKPDFHTSFTYDGKEILVNWFTVTAKRNIPNLAWKQIYAVANLNGLVPLVSSSTSEKPFNLPGGTVEVGESLDQTLTRELIEECNMRVISWKPLGYQICTEPDGTQSAQFRAYAEVEKIGEFTHDPGGGVIKNTLVPFGSLEQHIQYGKTGDILMQLANRYFI